MGYYNYHMGDDVDLEPEDLGLDCDFGAEFCDEPQTREMGLCTTDCRTYFAMVRAQEEQPSEWEKVLREKGKCGSCAGSLAEGYVNSVMLDNYATWEFPVWGNVLARDEDKQTLRRACTFLCDKCIDLMREGKAPPIKWAVEIYQEDDVYKLLYHDVTGLEAAEPITEADLED